MTRGSEPCQSMMHHLLMRQDLKWMPPTVILASHSALKSQNWTIVVCSTLEKPRAGLFYGYSRHSRVQMVGTLAVKAFVLVGKMDGKINLLVCNIFNDTVYVDSLNPGPANAGPPTWLNIRPSGEQEERKVFTRGSDGRRREDRENHFTDYLQGLVGF